MSSNPIKAVVRVTWTKTFYIGMDYSSLDQLRDDLMAQVETLIEKLDSAVGDRHNDPDDEKLDYEVLGEEVKTVGGGES